MRVCSNPRNRKTFTYDAHQRVSSYVTKANPAQATETKDTTASVKARLNLEESASPELVKDLIRNQITAENKKLKAKLGQLKRQLTSLTTKDGV